jgi:hypothetical protein
MGFLTYSKAWAAGDNGTIFGGSDLQLLQNDIASVINGGLTNSNFGSSAAVAESKFSFTTVGHDHDGSNSKTVSQTAQHFRKGLTLYGDDDDNVAVYPGTIEIDGEFLTATTASGDLAVATASNWINGSSTASQWCYVYVYNDDDAVGYKFSNEAPDLSDVSDNTAELPLRYRQYGSVYYRCIGCVFQDASSDLCWGQASSEGMFYSNFDASSMAIFSGLATGSDQTFNTIWTPKYVSIIYGQADTSPAAGETYQQRRATQLMLDTNWYGTSLNPSYAGNAHAWTAITNPGTINAITAQSAGTAGGFVIDAMTDNKLFYVKVFTDLV